jgi:hypothetical protein
MRRVSLLVLGLLVGLPLLLVRPAAVDSASSTGVVTSGDVPVAGALVRLKGTRLHTHTDQGGWFRLPARPGERLTAWQDGFFIGGSRVEKVRPFRLRLEPLPTDDNDEYSWVDPSPSAENEHACANCHAEIHREWAESGHARSATGRRFRNLYEGTNWKGEPDEGWGLLRDHPDGAGVCAACHAPAAPESAFLDLREVRGTAARGVHCDYCHKIADVADGKGGLNFGRFAHRLGRPHQGQLFFGPLDDVDRGEDAFSPLYRDSRYCASCHEGVVFGVHVYGTYSEWLESPARRQGKHCVSCHMAPTGALRNIAPGHGGIERDPHTLGNHRFFQPSREAMLARCLRLNVEARRQGTEVRVAVRLGAEEVGHRVPTGFVDRQLLLVVEGVDGAGRAVELREGPRLPAAAGPEFAGKPGRLHARLLRDEKGRAPVPFWKADTEDEDTRLRPGQTEEEVFRFGKGVERVRVQVRYRRFWDRVIRDKGWPDRDWVAAEREVRVQ